MNNAPQSRPQQDAATPRHLDLDATVPLYGASKELLALLKANDINPRRVHDQEIKGNLLSIFHTRPYDTTTYFATINLDTLEVV